MSILDDVTSSRQKFLEALASLREAEEEYAKAEKKKKIAEIEWNAALKKFDERYAV